MQTSEWTSRIETAERYLDAQYALMASATENAPANETLSRLDAVRRARIAFNSLPPAEFRENRDFSKTEVDDAVVFLEKSVKARKNDALLLRWIQLSAEWPEAVAGFEQAYGLDVDPDSDLLVVGNKNSHQLLESLKGRGFQRIIESKDILADDDSSKIDGEKFSRALRALPNISVVKPAHLHYLNCEFSDDVREKQLEEIRSRIALYYTSRNTVELMAEIWTPQVIKNVASFISNGKQALSLKNSVEGAVAIVIGAGPSLDKLLPMIREVQDKVIVFCAFKALKAVTAAGIDPDIVVCLDPKQKIRHLESVDLNRVGAFLVEVACNAEMVATIAHRPIIPFGASDIPLALVKSTGAADIPVIATGGSAVHGGLQAALLFGCRTIYFAGTDFGFPENRLYADGAGTGDRFQVAADGRTYERQPLDSHHRGGLLTPVNSNSGGMIGASVEMIQFREWTEARIEQSVKDKEGREFFNLCEDGAVIRGAEFVSVIDDPRTVINSKKLLRHRISEAGSVSRAGLRALKTRYQKRVSVLRKMVEICQLIESKNEKNQDWTSELRIMERQAKKCLEISALINSLLITLADYTNRVKTIGPNEADRLILKLVGETRSAAEKLIAVYNDAIFSNVV
jgi:hypothetical protein